MIKYNNSDIIDWNFGDNDIIKVYHNGAIVFYKFDTEQGGYKVCYAVVDDITQYSETEFEDVYDKATEKWYKLNNLNQYEEYGVYASGRTSCEGSTSRLPQGYTEVEYVENTSTAYIDTGVYIDTSNFEIGYTIGNKQQLFGYCHQGCGSCTWLGVEQSATMWWGNFNNNANISSYLTSGDNTIIFTPSGATINGTSISKTFSIGSDDIRNISLLIFARYDFNNNVVEHRTDSYMQVKSFYLKNNGTLVRDFVPCKRDSDNKYGMYDLVTNTFYVSPNNVDFSGGEPIAPTGCVTTYEGKLTIDDGYEYEWNGSSWVNLGEVSGSSRVPIGYTEVEYIQNTGTSYLDTNFVPNQDTRIVADMQLITLTDYPRLFGAGGWNAADGINVDYEGGHLLISWFGKTTWYQTTLATNLNRHVYDLNKNYLYVDETLLTSNTYTTKTASDHLAVFTYIRDGRPSTANDWNKEHFRGKLWSFQVYDNGTLVRDIVPCIKDSDNTVGAYDIVNDVFYTVPTGYTTDKLIAGAETGSTEYPKYYTEKSDPLDNLTFNTLEAAEEYAYNNCVYDGMHATIDGDRYYFDSTDENGWVKVTEYYVFEDVTPGGASGWTISGSSTYNPDSSYYDDFDIETTSTSNVTKIAKVTIYGYDHFTYYLRSNHEYPYNDNYAYVTASNIDELSTDPTSMSYASKSAVTNTYSFKKTAGSDVNLSNYRRVTYNNLDKTVEHTFYVAFYGRKSGNYKGDATILIPKEQTNENWEQVTFSASSNVESTEKYLYIDGNYQTSGGTQRWYSRWIIGLPSGSHSSYTTYSNYNYCQNVTSSTFTSVAGEQRQVNFTYNDTSNKSLSFRLVDSNGNVLTPSNTVYYNMYRYNSCNVSSNATISLPSTVALKVGGRFYFSSSSNRHYIYGYAAPETGRTYYVDNYSSTFDLVYTALTREAVSVTYTTYDPNDSETPAFKTDITWPYSGGTTSSTTLTSYEVPYTYSYEVSQTSDKFSAASQTYTAGQSSRTISFILYPNNREFATVADMEAYAYAWEGMRAIVGDTNYEYKNGEWTEITTDWYTLQDLIDTHTIIDKGNNKRELSPTVNGIAFFRVHTDKITGSGHYTDLYNDNLPSPPYFGIRDDSDIGLYQSVDGYSNLKGAANSTSCTWAYWIDENTIEVNAQAIMNDTMKIGYYNVYFPKLLLSFELPIA